MKQGSVTQHEERETARVWRTGQGSPGWGKAANHTHRPCRPPGRERKRKSTSGPKWQPFTPLPPCGGNESAEFGPKCFQFTALSAELQWRNRSARGTYKTVTRRAMPRLWVRASPGAVMILNSNICQDAPLMYMNGKWKAAARFNREKACKAWDWNKCWSYLRAESSLLVEVASHEVAVLPRGDFTSVTQNTSLASTATGNITNISGLLLWHYCIIFK